MTQTDPAKSSGSYYTSFEVARFLVDWAVRSESDLVLDPAFGDGVFFEVILSNEANMPLPGKNIYGVELDSEAYSSVVSRFSDRIPLNNLLNSDFFGIDTNPDYFRIKQNEIPKVDAVVGNPPYIRFHRFKGKNRELAQIRTKEMGVKLNGLSSSWAPFVIHAISFIKESGRLALVLPAEIMYAIYATPVVEFLTRSFRQIELLTFRKKLFPRLSEDTILLLADGKGQKVEDFWMKDFASVDELEYHRTGRKKVDIKSVLEQSSRLIEYQLSTEERALYQKLKKNPNIHTLGEFGRIGIGYVTGNNDYFHLTAEQAAELGIDSRYLSMSVRKTSSLRGLIYTLSDWEESLKSGEGVLLLDLGRAKNDLSAQVLKYIESGEQSKANTGFKCRTRSPWWAVPHVHRSEGFLTYMAGQRALLIVNATDAVASNSLHIVRLNNPDSELMRKLAVCWMTSLTALSTEIEGRSLGGGLLKLEPSEALRTLVAVPDIKSEIVNDLVLEIDEHIRNGNHQIAQQLADDAILNRIMSLKSADILLLQSAVDRLRLRRLKR